MSKADIEVIESRLEELSILRAAAEPWSHEYEKDPATHAAIIKAEAKIERVMRDYFRALAGNRVAKYVLWGHYQHALMTATKKAYDVNVYVDEDSFDTQENTTLLQVVHDPLLTAVAVGAQAGEAIYSMPLGLTSSSEAILEAARKYSSKLVTGVNITTRGRIQQSLQTSLQLGEDQAAATARLQGVVKDYARAGTIARTEAVNSYGQGLLAFADQSNATGKVWQANPGACVICMDNDTGDVVDINDSFPSGDDSPGAHPNCRCGMKLVYSNGDTSDVDSED